MARQTFNAHRLYQATFLSPILLQAGLGPTEHRLLEVLARMMADHTNPGTLTIIDTCFPSLLTLARETMYSERCVRMALDALLDAGLIRKSKIAGRKLHKGKNRNKFENNRYHVVPEVWDFYVDHSPFAKTYGAAPAFIKDQIGKISEKDQAVLDQITQPSAPVTRPQNADSSAILHLLKEQFGEHPTYALPNADRIMSKCVMKMISMAGSPERVIEYIGSLSDKSEADIRKSDRLGGYLEKCVADWIKNLPQSAASPAVSESPASSGEQQYLPDCNNMEELINYIQTIVPSTLDLRGDIDVWELAERLIAADPSHMTRRIAGVLMHAQHEFFAEFSAMTSTAELIEFLSDNYHSWSQYLEDGLPSSDDWSPLAYDAEAVKDAATQQREEAEAA